MYKIVLNDEIVIQDNIDNVVIGPILSERDNGAGSLTYSIPHNDQYYDLYKELNTNVKVFNGDNELPEFGGRLLNSTKNFNGFLKLKYEGDLALLNDILYPPYDFTGSVREFLTNVIEFYNSKCSNQNQIELGVITVEDPNNLIVRANQDYSSCWDVVNDKLIQMLGGHMYISYTKNPNGTFKRYINYVEDAGECTQEIKFGSNLLDLEKYIDATKVATVLIARGAEDEETGQRLGPVTIETQFIEQYGRIECIKDWDDITVLSNLQSKAQEYANQMVLKDVTINSKVIDLNLTDKTIEQLRIGRKVNLSSDPHDISASFIISERERNLNNPSLDTISLGTKIQSFTSNVVKREKEIVNNSVNSSQVSNMIKHQTDILVGASGGYVYQPKDENGAIKETIYMDAPTIEQSTHFMRVNYAGIGFSTNISGPYSQAWTLDGKLNANFIQAGTLSGIDLNINNNFIVNSAGVLTAKSGKFSGSLEGATITGTTGTFSGLLSTTSNCNVGGSLNILPGYQTGEFTKQVIFSDSMFLRAYYFNSGGRWIELYSSDVTRVVGGNQIVISAPVSDVFGEVSVHRTDIGLHHTHNTTGKVVGFGVGSGGNNRGLYDSTAGNWIIYRDSSNNTHTNASSDERLKYILGDLSMEESADLLESLPIKRFIYKTDLTDKHRTGIIAQDYKKWVLEHDVKHHSALQQQDKYNIQEFVDDINVSNDNVWLYIDYKEFIPDLWNGWKYHQEKIKQLEKTINEQQKQIDQLIKLIKGE